MGQPVAVQASRLTWGAGLLLMLTLAGGAHWLLGRLLPSTPRPA